MLSSPRINRRSPLFMEYNELEKYSKHLFMKTAQIVIQSRTGERTIAKSDPLPSHQAWFCLSIDDNAEVSHEAKRAGTSRDMRQALQTPHCIEISLKTSDGAQMVLENWHLSLKTDNCNDVSFSKSNNIYNHMSLMLKSVICTSRALPTYRLSKRQSSDTFVICYRIYTGEPDSSCLGEGFQSCQVGKVLSTFGTFQLCCDYRTNMHINPNLIQENLCGLSLSGNLPQNSLLTRSDHFSGSGSSINIGGSSNNLATDAENYPGASTSKDSGGNPRNPKNVRNLLFLEDSENAATSDESQEAMKLFAASPPDGAAFPDNYLSSRRKHSPYESEPTGKLKVGAFASKAMAAAVTSTIQIAGPGDDPIMDLFNMNADPPKLKENPSGDDSSAKEARHKLSNLNLCDVDSPSKSSLNPTKSNCSSTHSIPATQQGDKMTTAPATATTSSDPLRNMVTSSVFASVGSKKRFANLEEFEYIDFKTPFATQRSNSVNNDLGIFFKEPHSLKINSELGPSSFGGPKFTLGADSPVPGTSPITKITTTQTPSPASTTQTLTEREAEEEEDYSSLTASGKNELRGVQDLEDQLMSYEAELMEYDSLLKDLVTSESDTDIQG